MPTAQLHIVSKLASLQDFTPGRLNVLVDTIVIHTTEGGSIAGAVDWWAREDVIASAHYVVDGKCITQCVSEGDTAYHAGNRSMNRRSIGIEVVGHYDDPLLWTPELVEQLVALCAQIRSRHRNIPILHQAGPGICGHVDVPDPHHAGLYGGAHNHKDPGQFFPWAPFLDSLRVAELAKGVA